MSYDKKKLGNFLKEMLDNLTSDPKQFDHNKGGSIFGGKGSKIEIATDAGTKMVGELKDASHPTLYLSALGQLALDSFVDECLKDREFASKIGPDAITKSVQSTLCRLYMQKPVPADLDEVVKKEILQKLKAEITKINVRVPIKNLRVKSTCKIGVVTFVSQEEGILLNAKTVLDWGNLDTPEKIVNKASLLSTVNDISKQGTTWAIAEIEAHPNWVKEAAREEIDAAINLLRCFTHVFHSHSMRAAFGFPHELSETLTTMVSQSESLLTLHMDKHRCLAPFEITKELIDSLTSDFFFDDFVRIASASWDQLNSLEKAIRVAFRWLGRSIIALTITESFTHCAIALERLLIVDREETTVERFADRLTYLISQNAEERKVIHKIAKRLYDIRSKIVHAGFDSVSSDQLNEFENLAIRALVETVSLIKEVKDHDGLRQLLHDRKMA